MGITPMVSCHSWHHCQYFLFKFVSRAHNETRQAQSYVLSVCHIKDENLKKEYLKLAPPDVKRAIS